MNNNELTLKRETAEHLTKIAATKITKRIVSAIQRTGKKNMDDAIRAARKSRHLDDKFLGDLDDSFIKATYEKHMHGVGQRAKFKGKAAKTPGRRLSINVETPKKNFFGRAMDRIFGGKFNFSGKGMKAGVGTGGKETKLTVGFASGSDVHRQNLSRAARSQKEIVERGLANMQGATAAGFKKLPGSKPYQQARRRDISRKVKIMAGVGLAGTGAFALGRSGSSDNYGSPYDYKYASLVKTASETKKEAEVPVHERVKHKPTPQAINDLVNEWMHRVPPKGVQKETMAYSITKSAEAKNASATLPNQYAKTQQVNKALANVVKDLKLHTLSNKVDKLVKK